MKIWMFYLNLIRAEKAILLTKNSVDLVVCLYLYHQLTTYPKDTHKSENSKGRQKINCQIPGLNPSWYE